MTPPRSPHTRTHWRHCAALFPLLAVPLLCRPVLARQRAMAADTGFSGITALIDAGRMSQARDAFAQWNATHPKGDPRTTDAMRAHALLLEARLAATWDAAQAAYLGVALGYPVSDAASLALLRLGQGLSAAASTGKSPDAAARAAGYLERLVNDYPNSPHRTEGFLWLSRAQALSGRREAACQTLARAVQLQADSALTRQITADRRRTCGNGAKPTP